MFITRVGFTPWPKLFQNLRANRQTELSDEFPEHVVIHSLGNSQPVATKRYLRKTDDHLTKAATSPAALHRRCSTRPQIPETARNR